MYFFRIFTYIACTLILISCTRNPVTGQKELYIVDESKELAIGKENYPLLQQAEGGAYHIHPDIELYVQKVGQRLASVSDRPHLPFEFVIIHDSTPNAWALPGGKIGINRGLLYELESENELAAVLSHEIVHAAARHSAKMLERDMILNIGLIGLGMTLKSSRYRHLAMGAGGVGLLLVQKKHSRLSELEADSYGIKYMVRAGYDPYGAVQLQEKFLTLSKGKKGGTFERLFASHPPSQERIDANKRTVAQYHPISGKVGKDEYQRIMRPLFEDRIAYEQIEQGTQALEKNKFREAKSLAKKAISLQPRESGGYVLLGNIAYAQGKFKKAASYFTQAISHHPHYYQYYLLRGKTYHQLQNWPDMAQDFKISMRYLKTITAHYFLGQYALNEKNQTQAIFHFEQAQKGNTEEAKEAKIALERLLIPSNPENYLKVGYSLNPRGYLTLLIENQGSIPVFDISILVRVKNPSGNYSSAKRFTYERVIKPHGRGMLTTLVGPFPSVRHMEKTVLHKIESLKITY